MAPEQLEGKDADARTDIFAFGALLYEMVTGAKAFDGRSQPSLISAIMSSDPPPLSTRQPLAPPALERVIRTCLAKDPEDRFDTAHDLLLQLKWIAEGGSQSGVPAPVVVRRRPRELLAWAIAALALMAAGAIGVLHLRETPAAGPVVRFTLPAADGVYSQASLMRISPDGRHAAFAARDANRKWQLWIRSLDSTTARALGDSESGASPWVVWSADSRFVAFESQGKLKKVPVAGGPAQTLCDVQGYFYGGTWSRDNVILFGTSKPGNIYRVPADGGAVEPVTTLDRAKEEVGHWWPHFLPDGDHFLYLAASFGPGKPSEGHTLYVRSLSTGQQTRLMQGGSRAEYVEGRLLFIRDGALLAAPFDVNALRTTGDPSPIADNVGYFRPVGAAEFSTSRTGTLTYAPAFSQQDQLAWFDRLGKRLGAINVPGSFEAPRISPDGAHVALALNDTRTGTSDLWIYGVTRQTSTRVTFEPGWENQPVWSPDGAKLAYASDRQGIPDVYLKVLGSSGVDAPLVQAEGYQPPTDWSRDDRFLLFLSAGSASAATDIWVLPLQGERKPYAVVQTPSSESSPRFSPDTRWVAYSADETGTQQIYLRPFPDPGPVIQVSRQRGTGPRWRGDGRELYFRNDRQFFAVDVDSAAGTTSEPRLLFEASADVSNWDVMADGKRFLLQMREGSSAAPTTVVLNWAQSLK